MARKATASGGSKAGTTKRSGSKSSGSSTRAVATVKRAAEEGGNAAADAFLKILQSPIVADLIAVAAMAALAALAEHGFNSKGSGDNKRRAGRAVKEAGKAAAAAVGRRLANEVDEIRKASKLKRGGAG